MSPRRAMNVHLNGGVELKMEPWSLRSVEADSHHMIEDQDPDPH
jgi:hypothetical protein